MLRRGLRSLQRASVARRHCSAAAAACVGASSRIDGGSGDPGPPVGTNARSDGVEHVLRHFGVQRVRPWLAGALADVGFGTPSPIQAAAMPLIAHHNDTIVHAATGSGKTLAFLVPILSRLEPSTPLQLLILLPSRELAVQMAAQVSELIGGASGLSLHLLVGGARGPSPGGGHVAQFRELDAEVSAKRAAVVVATPHALLRQLRLADTVVGGAGNTLLLRLARSLDAVVFDELDALLPRPRPQGRAGRGDDEEGPGY